MAKPCNTTLNTTVALRLPDQTVTELDALVEHFGTLAKARVTRSAVCRRLLEHAVNSEARKVLSKPSK